MHAAEITRNAIKDLKPSPGIMLPSSEYSEVSVYALSSNVKESWIIQNPHKRMRITISASMETDTYLRRSRAEVTNFDKEQLPFTKHTLLW